MEEEIFPDTKKQAERFAEQMREAKMVADTARTTFSRTIESKGWFGAVRPQQETAYADRRIWFIARGQNLVGKETVKEQKNAYSGDTVRDETSIAVTPEGSVVVVTCQTKSQNKEEPAERWWVAECGSSLKPESLFGNYAENDLDLDTLGDKVGKLLVRSAQHYAAENQKTDTNLTRDYKIVGSVYAGGLNEEDIVIDLGQWTEKAHQR